MKPDPRVNWKELRNSTSGIICPDCGGYVPYGYAHSCLGRLVEYIDPTAMTPKDYFDIKDAEKATPTVIDLFYKLSDKIDEIILKMEES